MTSCIHSNLLHLPYLESPAPVLRTIPAAHGSWSKNQRSEYMKTKTPLKPSPPPLTLSRPSPHKGLTPSHTQLTLGKAKTNSVLRVNNLPVECFTLTPPYHDQQGASLPSPQRRKKKRTENSSDSSTKNPTKSRTCPKPPHFFSLTNPNPHPPAPNNHHQKFWNAQTSLISQPASRSAADDTAPPPPNSTTAQPQTSQNPRPPSPTTPTHPAPPTPTFGILIGTGNWEAHALSHSPCLSHLFVPAESRGNPG